MISINLARTKLERSFQRNRKFTGASQEPEGTACSTPSDKGVFGGSSPEHFHGFASPQEQHKFGVLQDSKDRTCKSSIKKRRMLRKIRKS